jgi:hypothetical protein
MNIRTVLLCVALSADPAYAQFVTPVPNSQSSEFARSGYLRRSIQPAVLAMVSTCNSRKASDSTADFFEKCLQDEVKNLSTQYCETQINGRIIDRAAFLKRCQLDSTVVSWIVKERTALPRNFAFPLFQGRPWMVEWYQGSIGLDVLSRFGANVSEKEVLVMADMLSGVVGVLPFAVSAASMVIKPPEGSSPDSAEEITSLRADLTKLIHNGGSVSSRIQAPIYFKTGTTWRAGGSAYAQIGYLGSRDDPSAVGTMVVEMVNAFTIREPRDGAAQIADILLAGRIGHSWKDSSFSPELAKHKLAFAQLAVGIMRDNGEMAAQVLLTYSPDRVVRNNIPKVLFNLSATR